MSRRRPKNNTNGEWKAQKPMWDKLSDAADEDGKDDDDPAGLLHNSHVVCCYGYGNSG